MKVNEGIPEPPWEQVGQELVINLMGVTSTGKEPAAVFFACPNGQKVMLFTGNKEEPTQTCVEG